MKENYKYIGENVRKARQEKNLTIEQLAELIDVTSSYLGVAERGTSGFSVEVIIKLAQVLGITTDSLLMENNPVEPTISSKLNILQTLLQNKPDDELDFIIDYIELCRTRITVKQKNVETK